MAPFASCRALALILLPCARAFLRSLNDETWAVSNGSIRVETKLPAVAHTALMAAGVLQGDPFYRYNELAWGWVGLTNWRFSTNVTLDDTEVAAASLLQIDGLDTVADVYVNNVHLGRGVDAFVRWRFPLPKGLLVRGTNAINVSFVAPKSAGVAAAAAYPYVVPASLYYHTWSDSCESGQACHAFRNFVRKPPADFGWDWGPSFMPTGITGAVALVGPSTQLQDLSVAQEHHADGTVTLSLAATLGSAPGALPFSTPVARRVVYELCFPRCDAAAERHASVGRAHAEALPSSSRTTLHIPSPRRWWPRGYGAPALYELRACLVDDKAKGCQGTALSRRVGLRKVELVQHAASPPDEGLPAGTTFYFKINDVPVFIKGTNFIPVDVFEPRATNETLHWLLKRAATANMNMLRVWGGGRYQTDAFYDMADEMGLLIWQEMMFACALYPRDEAFLSLVHREVSEQVRRLSTHASIVIWGGNNENEGALRWYGESRDNPNLYVADYVKLYIDTLRPAIAAADAEARPFVDSSPSNGLLSSQPYVKRWGDVQAWSWGDVHYYNYAADCEDITTYPKARFVSEHGFQSFPSFRVYQTVLAPADFARGSSATSFRQRHEGGDDEILQMMARHFRVPPANVSGGGQPQADLFAHYLYLTQLQQARCYEAAFGQWRRLRSADANTMGILYWQLNDVWQGPSWSSVEYDGSLKLTHYAVARVYAPLLVSAVEADGELVVHLTSDLQHGTSANLTVEVHKWSSSTSTPAFSFGTTVVSVGAGTSQPVLSAAIAPLLSKVNATRPEVFLRISLVPIGGVKAELDSRGLESFHWLTQYKDALLPASPSIAISYVRMTSSTSATLTLESNSTAAFVAVESFGVVGAFSDGAFMMLPNRAVKIDFEAKAPFDVEKFVDGLLVRSLSDTF